jgi:hypothetical protein
VAGDLACQILYRSTTITGKPTAISGTLLVPGAAYSGTRPIVAYAPGTQGWAQSCAPSIEMASNSFDEQFAVNNLLAQGWAVVVTDYPGQGTPGPELYGAAGWAAQLQPQYAPSMHLAGVAMGGTPANLQAVAANINAAPSSRSWRDRPSASMPPTPRWT